MIRTTTLLGISLLLFVKSASATMIVYELDDLGDADDTTWQYNYTVDNSGPASMAFDGFTVFFAEGLFENLLVTAAPLDWDAFTDDPIPGTDDGIFDALSFFGVAVGDIVSGFSVAFDFLGAGLPGAQDFETYTCGADIFCEDPNEFAIVAGGTTEATATAVPEPSTLALFGLGLIALSMARRRRQSALISRR